MSLTEVQKSEIQTNRRYLTWITALTGVILPLAAAVFSVLLTYVIHPRTVDYSKAEKLFRELSFATVAQYGLYVVIGIIYLASPYVYLAYKGYSWIDTTISRTTESPSASKTSTVMKWTYAGSLVMGFAFYFSITFYDLNATESGASLLLFSPAPYVIPLFGALLGFLIGWFVARIKPRGEVPRQEIDSIW